MQTEIQNNDVWKVHKMASIKLETPRLRLNRQKLYFLHEYLHGLCRFL